jgi:hypothetical protein
MDTNNDCGRGTHFFSVKEVLQEKAFKELKYESLLSLRQYKVLHNVMVKSCEYVST